MLQENIVVFARWLVFATNALTVRRAVAKFSNSASARFAAFKYDRRIAK